MYKEHVYLITDYVLIFERQRTRYSKTKYYMQQTKEDEIIEGELDKETAEQFIQLRGTILIDMKGDYYND